MKKKIFIDGMTCQHCVRRVKNALENLDGVTSVDINLEDRYSLVELSKDIDRSIFNEAIDDAGYNLISIEDGN